MAGFETTDVAAHVGQGVPQSNLYDTLGHLAQLQNAMNENRAFQAKALGNQYFERSVGPDGRPDPAALNQFLRSDPRTAPYAAEILGTALTQQGQGITNATGAQGLAAKRAGAVHTIMGSIKPSSNTDPAAAARENQINAVTALAPMLSAGVIDPQTFMSYATMTPEAFETARKAAVIGGEAGAYAQDANFGKTEFVDNGPNIQPTNVNTVQGAVSPVGSPIAKALTPAEAASGVESVDPVTGVHTRTPLAQVHGPVTTSVPLGAEAQANAAGTVTGHQSGATFAGLADGMAKARETKASAELLEGYLKDKDFSTGPQTKIGASLGELLQGLGMQVPENIKNGTAAVEDFRHYATNILATQTASLGGTGTDAAREKAAQITPSEMYSKLGDRGIIAGIKGNADAQVVQGALSRQWLAKHPNTTGADFQNWFQKHYNPLVFTAQYLDKAQQAQLFAGMSPAARAQYKADAAYAIKHLYIGADASVGQ